MTWVMRVQGQVYGRAQASEEDGVRTTKHPTNLHAGVYSLDEEHALWHQ